jgi:hypothetical protein
MYDFFSLQSSICDEIKKKILNFVRKRFLHLAGRIGNSSFGSVVIGSNRQEMRDGRFSLKAS